MFTRLPSHTIPLSLSECDLVNSWLNFMGDEDEILTQEFPPELEEELTPIEKLRARVEVDKKSGPRLDALTAIPLPNAHHPMNLIERTHAKALANNALYVLWHNLPVEKLRFPLGSGQPPVIVCPSIGQFMPLGHFMQFRHEFEMRGGKDSFAEPTLDTLAVENTESV